MPDSISPFDRPLTHISVFNIVYFSLIPLRLDAPGRDDNSTAGSFGYPSTVFKVVSERSGIALALRRLSVFFYFPSYITITYLLLYVLFTYAYFY